MAKRIYKAKDKLVQRRVRGAMVEENVRTKKRRRVGKKDVELDVNMARGPDDAIDALDGALEEGKPAPGRTKAAKREASRYDRDEDVELHPRRHGRGQPRQLARGREAIEETEAGVESFLETDKPLEARAADIPQRSRSQRRQAVRAADGDAVPQGRGTRFKYRSDDLRDRSARDTGDKKREQRRNANRLHYDEEEKRLEAEISEQAEVESADTPDTEAKPRKQWRALPDDGGMKMEAGSEEPVEGLEESTDGESHDTSEVKQRQRAQANAFREAKAKEEAAAETFETLTEGEIDRTESLASTKRKSRINFSDEGSGFVHGAGRIAKRTVKTAAAPAMLYAGQQLREAGEENDGVRAAEASGLTARKTATLAKSSKRSANRRSASKARAENVKQEHAAQVEHRKKEQIRAFHKKKRQRAAIAAKRKQSVVSAGGFVESAETSFSIPEKAKKAAQSFFAEHKGAIIGVAAAGLIFALIGVSMSSVASLVHGGGTTVISTTYVSTDEDIYAAENAYCALEDGLNAQVYGLQSSHPGYDDYEYQIDEIEHNPYHLISYLQVKFGGFTYNNEVKAEINRLFRQQYTLSLSAGSEMRTRVETVMETREVYDEETGLMVIEEYPVEQEVEYEHETHDAKGIHLRIGFTNPVAEITLSWAKVAQRIDALMRNDRYLTTSDHARMPDYEREVMARRIRSFYYHMPQDIPRPVGADLIAAEDRQPIADALMMTDTAVELVNQMDDAMAALPTDHEHYQECTDILFQVHDYIDGTYTIFPEPPWKKEPTAQNQQMSMFSLLEQPGESEQEMDEDEPEEEIEESVPDVEAETEAATEVSASVSDDPDRLTDAEYAEYNALKVQYPDTLIGFEHNGFFEFYGENARRVAERLDIRLIERETPEGTVQATGFAADQWQSNARMLWQHGESVYLSGIAEDGSREEVKHLRAEDLECVSKCILAGIMQEEYECKPDGRK